MNQRERIAKIHTAEETPIESNNGPQSRNQLNCES